MRKMLLIAMLGSSSFLFPQTVCIGTAQQCIEIQRHKCALEPAPANFELSKVKVVTGTVADKSGASFNDIEVQLRIPKRNTVLRSVAAKDGAFNLGKVKGGSYRLIVVKQGKQGVERLPLADRPRSLDCADKASTCRLPVVLTFHGTDNMIDFCPPK